ncbi:uncharacterized protein LOC122056927 [Macadamia integrifolia]|uniref:uncharacterized protein LOC122056927 n=1 Tax=Macadamia integrifolia TaxID=60698 RepID=UPI001C53023E|nr:uncharacterized protein LOC122056927 [Macadamia integrifolia]
MAHHTTHPEGSKVHYAPRPDVPLTQGQMTPQSQAILPIPMDSVKVMETFQKFRPPYFCGITQDPLAPTKWVEGMEKAFKVMTLTEEQKLMCADYRLQNEANAWWKSTEPILVALQPNLTWEHFKMAFYNNYFPDSVRERKETEFMELKQGSNSVLEYQQDFEKLFFFAPENFKGDQAKAKRFEKGLKPTIGAVLVAQYLHSYAQVVQAAKSIEDKQKENYHAIQGKRIVAPSRFGKGTYSSAASGQYKRPETGQAPPPPRPMVAQSQIVPLRCFVCQQTGHFAKNCSQRRPGDPYVGPTRSVQPLSATHLAQAPQEARLQGKVFALTTEEAEASPGVVTEQGGTCYPFEIFPSEIEREAAVYKIQ